jgi:hypothetical protein
MAFDTGTDQLDAWVLTSLSATVLRNDRSPAPVLERAWLVVRERNFPFMMTPGMSSARALKTTASTSARHCQAET